MPHRAPTQVWLARIALVPLLAVAALLTPALSSGASAQAAPSPRAMWVWDVSTPEATVQLALDHGIGQLFVAVPPNLPKSSLLPSIREISQRAGAAGIRVDALGGDPGWVDNATWVVNNWLKPAMGTGLFTGVHVDIEPYTTPAWQTDQAGVVTRYLTTLTTLGKAAGTAPLEADIPFWFHEVPAGATTLDRAIISRTAGVSVMAYRNTAAGEDGTIALATPALAAATDLGKPARVGQETRYLGDSPVETKQTFFGQTRSAMEVQLSEIGLAFSGLSGYGGIAIHDSVGFAGLAP